MGSKYEPYKQTLLNWSREGKTPHAMGKLLAALVGKEKSFPTTEMQRILDLLCVPYTKSEQHTKAAEGIKHRQSQNIKPNKQKINITALANSKGALCLKWVNRIDEKDRNAIRC